MEQNRRGSDIEYTWSGFFIFLGFMGFVLAMAYAYYRGIMVLVGNV